MAIPDQEWPFFNCGNPLYTPTAVLLKNAIPAVAQPMV
jgi:hypothetical protein